MMKKLILNASALAIALTATAAIDATAATTSDQVYSISLKSTGISGFVTIKNISANKHVNSVNIQPTQGNISFSLDGWVSCEKPQYNYASEIVLDQTKAVFGTANILGNAAVPVNSLYEKKYTPRYAYWKQKGITKFTEKVIVDTNQQPFVVPLAAIKNGHPSLRFDPVAPPAQSR